MKNDTQYNIHEILKKRHSTVSYDQQQVPEEMIRQLFEAARWAPSSYNEQPWYFLYGTKGQGTYEKLWACLNEGNKGWAGNAPLLVLAVVKEEYSHNGVLNKHAHHDLGQAIAHLTFEATANDLYLRQMGGFSAEKAADVFGIHSPYLPLTMMAIGFKGDPSDLPEIYQKKENRPRIRKKQSEFVFNGEWPL